MQWIQCSECFEKKKKTSFYESSRKCKECHMEERKMKKTLEIQRRTGTTVADMIAWRNEVRERIASGNL